MVKRLCRFKNLFRFFGSPEAGTAGGAGLYLSFLLEDTCCFVLLDNYLVPDDSLSTQNKRLNGDWPSPDHPGNDLVVHRDITRKTRSDSPVDHGPSTNEAPPIGKIHPFN